MPVSRRRFSPMAFAAIDFADGHAADDFHLYPIVLLLILICFAMPPPIDIVYLFSFSAFRCFSLLCHCHADDAASLFSLRWLALFSDIMRTSGGATRAARCYFRYFDYAAPPAQNSRRYAASAPRVIFDYFTRCADYFATPVSITLSAAARRACHARCADVPILLLLARQRQRALLPLFAAMPAGFSARYYADER